MKFLMFADLHYDPGCLPGATWDTLRTIQKRAEDEGCDFILHAGDFCYDTKMVADFIEDYNNFHIPSYHCLGNHDCDYADLETVLKAYNMPNGYYHFDCKGYRIIVLDTNYFCADGQYIHYAKRNQKDYPGNSDYMNPEQIDWLKKTIEDSPYPCLIVSHASFEREHVPPTTPELAQQLAGEANASPHAEDMRRLFREINEKDPHKVLMVMNGHHHHDTLRLIDNILYWDVNATAYEWVGKPGHDYFPPEITDNYTLAKYTIFYNDPLIAVVTIEGTTIQIDGTESSFYKGITREMVGDYVLDRSGRPTRPKIQSAKLTLL